MTHAHIQHVDTSRGGCWTCTHWHGKTTGGVHAICEKDAPRLLVMGDALSGCVYWEREVGADDEVPPACARDIG